MGMILRIASSRIVGQGDIVGRSGYFSLNLSANSVMRGRLDARRTLKSLVADLRQFYFLSLSNRNFSFDDLLVRKVVGGTAVHFVIIVVIIFITYVITNPSDSSLSNI